MNKKYFSKFFSNNSRDLVEKTRTGLEKVSRPQENAEKEKIDINNGDSIGDKISNELGLFDGWNALDWKTKSGLKTNLTSFEIQLDIQNDLIMIKC